MPKLDELLSRADEPRDSGHLVTLFPERYIADGHQCHFHNSITELIFQRYVRLMNAILPSCPILFINDKFWVELRSLFREKRIKVVFLS